MRIAGLAFALLLPAASAAEAPPAPRPLKGASTGALCDDPFRPRPARPSPKAEARKLGELPRGDLTLAVVDKVDGCIEPRIVRHGIGAAR